MAALRAAMEVLVIRPVEHVQTIKHILGRMTMYHVEENNDAHAMGSVDQLLKVFRRAISAAGGEEVVDLVAEAGVVGMLHDSHQLDGIVPQIPYPREHGSSKLLVSRYAKLGGGDANMSFVDPKALGLLRPRMFELVLLGRWRVPEYRIICHGNRHVLGHIFDPSRKAICPLAIGQSK